MRDETRAWLAQAAEDERTADFNLGGGRFYASVFFSQQATEKILKALFIHTQGSLPPKNHDLVSLARALQAPEAIMEEVRELNPEYFTTRYPDAAVGIPADMYSAQSAQKHLDAARRVMRWARSRLPSAPSPPA